MQELEPILGEIRNRKRVALGFGLMAVGFGVAAPFLPAEDSGGWAMYSIMSFMILFGGYWLVYGLLPATWSGGIAAISKHPEHIVWFYIGEEGSQEQGWLKLYLQNGKSYSYLVEHNGRLALLDYIANIAPQAQQGYSFEHLRLFQEDPMLLRKDNH